MSESKRDLLPVLPLRDMVVFPHGVHPLFVGTKRSIVALDSAMADDKQIFLVAKKIRKKPTSGPKISTTWARSRRSYSFSSCLTVL